MNNLDSIEAKLQDALSLIRAIKNETRPEPHRPSLPPVGIVVGHGRLGDEGAFTTTGVSEFTFNCSVAKKIKELLPSCVVLEASLVDGYNAHQAWVSDKLNAAGVSCALELHFNAANGLAVGYEYLYWNSSKKGEALARALEKSHAYSFPAAVSRGIKSIDWGDRGAGFLGRDSFPKVICEPFFGDTPREWDAYRGMEDLLAASYVNALKSAGYA